MDAAPAHARGLKVILDFLPNHTSNQHPWVQESKSLRDNPKRNGYLWRDPGKARGPPNNWLSNFGGPAWTLDPATGQHYYHAFLSSQPDLNWRNPEVQEAMHDVLRFWLDHGVDGFRVEGEALGSANLFIPADGHIFVCPELIVHYVNAHGYVPPPQFCRAVLACPPMRSMAYLRALLACGGGRLIRRGG